MEYFNECLARPLVGGDSKQLSIGYDKLQQPYIFRMELSGRHNKAFGHTQEGV